MDNISDLFNKFIEKKGILKDYENSRIINDWNKIFGDIAKYCKCIEKNGKRIIVRVEDPAWRQELTFMENKMVETINNYYKKEIVRKIIFI